MTLELTNYNSCKMFRMSRKDILGMKEGSEFLCGRTYPYTDMTCSVVDESGVKSEKMIRVVESQQFIEKMIELDKQRKLGPFMKENRRLQGVFRNGYFGDYRPGI